MTKKAENKVTQGVQKGIDVTFKVLEMIIELIKMRKQVKDAEKDITKVRETLIPTITEKLDDEFDEFCNNISKVQTNIRER